MAQLASVPVTVRVTVGADTMDLEDWELFTVLRRKNELTQLEVAAEAGTNQPWLSKWERGRLKADEERLDALWRALFTLVREKREAAVAA